MSNTDVSAGPLDSAAPDSKDHIRSANRISLGIPGTMTMYDGRAVGGTVADISRLGAGFIAGPDLKSSPMIDEPIKIVIEEFGTFDAVVARVTARMIGVKFKMKPDERRRFAADLTAQLQR